MSWPPKGSIHAVPLDRDGVDVYRLLLAKYPRSFRLREINAKLGRPVRKAVKKLGRMGFLQRRRGGYRYKPTKSPKGADGKDVLYGYSPHLTYSDGVFKGNSRAWFTQRILEGANRFRSSRGLSPIQEADLPEYYAEIAQRPEASPEEQAVWLKL